MGQPTGKPPEPPTEEGPPAFQPDLDLISLMERGRKDPKEIWLREHGPNAKKPWWKRLLGPFAA